MPRTLLMVSQPTVAGVAQCVLDWSVGLREHGWRVVVACTHEGWLAPRLTAEGIVVTEWPAVRNPLKAVRPEARDLRRILRTVEPDAVFLQGSKAGLIGRLVLRGTVPTAFAPHSWSFEAVTGVVGAAALRWERWAGRWTQTYICVSEAESALGRRCGLRGPFVVARNGIDLRTVAWVPDTERQQVRRDLGVPPTSRTLVCVGRVCRQKGQDILLQAWPQLAAAADSLTFVGGGPDLDSLAASTTDPRVRFTGDVDRNAALAWMAAADLVVLPSRWEGMALVPLESLATGTPVVASDVNGAREVIDDTVGRLCPPDDAERLATAVGGWMAGVADNPDVRRLCRRHVEEGFDVRRTVATIDDALQRMYETGK